MPLDTKSRIIVLHLTKFSDSGIIVHAIDSNAGRQSFLLRGVGKNKRTIIANFHNLSILDIVSSSSHKSELHYLKEYEPSVCLEALRSDPVKSSIALFISEILYRSIFENQMDSSMFEWITGSIALLDQYEGKVANFHLWFLVGLCSKLGFYPKNNYSDDNRIFKISSECFIPVRDDILMDSDTFNETLSELLHKLLTLPFEAAMNLQLAGSQRNAFSQKILDYLSYHLGITIKVKSLSILHDIFVNFV